MSIKVSELIPENMDSENPEKVLASKNFPVNLQPEEAVNMTPSAHRISKLNRLKNEAMDFSMRNALLSKPEEDALIFPLDAQRYFKGGYDDSDLFLCFQNAMQEAGMAPEKRTDCLFELLSADRQMRKNCGRGILYLAVGEMIWQPQDVGQDQARNETQDGKPEVMRRAPLYLSPAEIYRNLRGEYVFRADRKQTFFNPVLVECLHQYYGIDLSALRSNPADEDGYAAEMEKLTYAIGGQKGWKVEMDTAQLSLYRVQNEAIWRGLSDEKLLEHPVVKGLLEGAMTWDNELSVDEAAAGDEDAVYAFQADSSQSQLIRSVYRKRAQVVTGSAGNGKSQTIANIIVEQMRRGKNVLFVAEKLSAMTVIGQKLSEAGLGQFCLMLPDGQSALSAVKEKVASALKGIAGYTPGKPFDDRFEKDYREAVGRLHQYGEWMKKKDAPAGSLAELLTRNENLKKVPLLLDGSAAGEAMNGEEAREIILAFQEARRLHPGESSEYMPYMRFADMPQEELDRTRQEVQRVLDVYQEMREGVIHFEELLNIKLFHESIKAELTQVLTYAQSLENCPVVGPELAEKKSEDGDSDELLRLTREMVLAAPGSERHEEAGEKLWSRLEKLSAREEYQPRGIYDLNYWERELTGESLEKYSKKQAQQLKQQEKFDKFRKSLENLLKDRPESERQAVMQAALEIGRGSGEELLTLARKLMEQYTRYRAALGQASESALQNTEEFAGEYPDKMKVDLLKDWIRINGDSGEPDERLYQRVCRRAYTAGLGDLIRQMETCLAAGRMTVEDIPDAFEKCRCVWNIEVLQKHTPEMMDFAYVDYKIYLKQYRENEQAVRAELLRTLPDTVMAYMPNIREGIQDSTELGALQKLIRRSGAQVSVRQIFESAPNIMRQIFPCILMGPESVAQYLPAGSPEFDLVIFDEASQLPTYKALIPVSRGFQALFFGDEKQLTPTAFFQRNVPDEDGAGTRLEAVLEDAIITSMPQQMLRYHYRSQYEGLMAFSNNRYYEGELVTFPDREIGFSGIHWDYVEDGCYDRGGTRSNRKEAERVIALVQEIYGKLPEDTTETLGVITFNVEQMRLLQTMLREAVLAQTFCAKQMEELVDVVNLEACQGREWDRTVLSMTYGPDAEGNFSANLGPMTRDDGGNRLNVMTTRSKKEMYVVSSMTPELFDGGQTGGNRDIRDFMAFARGDFTFDTSDGEGADAEGKGLCGSVAGRLAAKGYTVHTNIGSSSCKVDIGVEALNGRFYKLGILLDDFADGQYQMRDREVIIPGMLESKGWKVYRLHAMNWYENADYELKQIENLLMQ